MMVEGVNVVSSFDVRSLVNMKMAQKSQFFDPVKMCAECFEQCVATLTQDRLGIRPQLSQERKNVPTMVRMPAVMVMLNSCRNQRGQTARRCNV